MSLCVAAMLLSGCGGSSTPIVPSGADALVPPSGRPEPARGGAFSGGYSGTYKLTGDGIVYTRAKLRIENSQYNLDLNNDGTTDFAIDEYNSKRESGCPRGGLDEDGSLSLMGQGSDGFEVSGGDAARLISGSPIGSSKSFMSDKSWIEDRFVEYQNYGGNCVRHSGAVGNWAPPSSGYLGLAFSIDGKIHYGWAAMIVKGQRSPGVFLHATLTGYAYQTKAGKSIRAGQK